MFCPTCGKESATDGHFCPYCGNGLQGQASPAALGRSTTTAHSKAPWIVGGICLFIVIAVIAGNIQDQRTIVAPGGAISPALTKTDSSPTLKIDDVETKSTEDNEVWTKYAWRLTVSNQGGEDEAFEATLEWQDKDGFVVDSQEQHQLTVAAHNKQTFTGYTLIDHPAADKVASIVAKLKR